jgi:PIN domain nuclease of toxin-antitoxin system
MTALLDTHTLLWFLTGDPRLSVEGRRFIDDPTNRRLVSVISLWEMAIKAGIGRLRLARPFDEMFPSLLDLAGLELLPLEFRHLRAVPTLPLHHRDPFDRALVSIAMAEGIPLVSGDAELGNYPAKLIW